MVARYAAKGGVDVLLIDKERVLGERVCGEGISQRGLADAQLPSQDCIRVPVYRVEIHGPRGASVALESPGRAFGYIVDKPEFLSSLAEAAQAAGADIRLRTRLIHIARTSDGFAARLRTPEGVVHVHARAVAGCDGIGSFVWRSLVGPWRTELVSCYQYRMSGVRCEDETLYFFVGSNVAPGGYAWIFPRGEGEANVGLGVRGTNPRPFLKKFVRDHELYFRNARIVKRGAWAVPVGGPLPRCVFDRLIFCGDAAGHVMPITGGGIRSSLLAGREAGRVLAKALRHNALDARSLSDFLYSYHRVYGCYLLRGLKARYIADHLTDRDLHDLITIVRAEDLVRAASGRGLTPIILRLLSKPRLFLKLLYLYLVT